MQYALSELLTKLGAPEARERGSIRWHYFEKGGTEIGGFAEVRLVDGGAGLIAEMARNVAGAENFYLYAKRVGAEGAAVPAQARYEVTKISFDGEEYAHPQKSVIELGLSLFHARALDISILMVEQAFNKDDMLLPVVKNAPLFEGVPVRKRAGEQAWGVVVPFRPRRTAATVH